MEVAMTVPEGPTAKRRFLSLWDDIWAFAHDNPDRFMFIESQIHEPWISPANRARKEALGEQSEELLAIVGVRASADLAQAMTTGTLTAILRSGSPADKAEVGERLWNALRTA